MSPEGSGAPGDALPAEALRRRCDPASLPFRTTAELDPLDAPLGQDRALAALRFAVGMRADGYNLFALGPEGTGKLGLIRRSLEQTAAGERVPDDWVYVQNFDEPHRPLALRLPAGRGQVLKQQSERLIQEIRLSIPAAFDSDKYRQRRNALEEGFKRENDGLIEAVQARAASRGIALTRTPIGFALMPIRDGEVLAPERFGQLPQAEQARLKGDMDELQQDLEERLSELPQHTRRQREALHALDRESAAAAIAPAMEEIQRHWRGSPAVLAHLERVRADILENIQDYVERDNGEPLGPPGLVPQGPGEDLFRRHCVNVLVNHAETRGAPVVFEDHPTHPNLVGRVEHQAQLGALITDFNLIKAGALHRANGGYLILEARKLLLNPYAWEDLKRALSAHEVRIEPPSQLSGMLPTVTLEPAPIPLDIKVVLVGEPMLYYALAREDPEFSVLFKVAADFDWRMARTPENELGLARLLAGMIRAEKLRPLDATAVASVIEYASRLAGDGDKLSTHMASIADLVREAQHWARERRARVVRAHHVQEAIDAHTFRHDRVRENVLEEIRSGLVHIATEGAEIGQINGLVVLQLGKLAFGRPGRITCRAHLGHGDVLDIEREVALGGPLHSKGVMILSSFLSARFAQDQPLSLSASLVFEQSYAEVEGDSASSAELYCLLSALAELPLRQDLAVTGAVDQGGRVQAIGGVNEKIEGFFDVCRARGLTGSQGVLIPGSNRRHLMLRPDVVEACAQGRFHIHAVGTIDEGMALLTGVPAGACDAGGVYPVGTVNRRVAARLAQFARKARDLRLDLEPQVRRNRGEHPA